MARFGLIGKTLAHSFSQKYFTEKFSKLGLDHVYDLVELPKIDQSFSELLRSGKYQGLNVTIPYKQEVIPHLDGLSPEAEAIGAVNTITFTENGIFGHNTDAFGFHQSIKPFLASHHERALVLGTGGASKAVVYVLKQLGINYMKVSRNPQAADEISYQQLNENAINYSPLIINCTPLGTFPKVEEFPDIPCAGISERHLLVDLIYNPAETQFMAMGKAQGATTLNGYDMLVQQAEKAWSIWNG